MKRLVRHPAAQAVFAWLLGLYLRFALRTTRWRLEGAEHLGGLAAGAPHIVAFWHERLPLMPQIWRATHLLPGARPPRGHVLISGHRDGRLIGAAMRHFNLAVVSGSSSRGAAAAMLRLAELLRGGEAIAITPDGPRGPRRQAAPGVAQLAALAGVPVLPCAAQTSRRLVLRSWDRMVVPWPFGQGVIVCRPAMIVNRQDWRTALPLIEDAMSAAADQADRLCPA
ncbi:MAG TPA: lysophospholipid acyltransferase family protein [Acetobacteraceae bacterium]|nr:lysophospholipid acyltransferase family protein [Acetobacteraceae bacterium]